MRASHIVTVAVLAAVLLTAVGVGAWRSSAATEGDPAPQAHTAPLVPEPVPTPVAPASAPPAAAIATNTTPSPPPADVPATAQMDERMTEEHSEAAHRSQRFLHSRRDDGQHAE